GICVGMQVLFEYGEEHSAPREGTPQPGSVVTKGLGLLPGGVTRLRAERIPHMGWNKVTAPGGSRLFAGVEAGARCYFVHSDAATPIDGQGIVTTTVHGGEFVAAVEHGPLWATQFHPEKSGDDGAILLRNWVRELT